MFNTLLYIDPGTGIIIIQFLISLFAGVIIFFKKIKAAIKIKMVDLKKFFKKY
jgi:hypothetical protein